MGYLVLIPSNDRRHGLGFFEDVNNVKQMVMTITTVDTVHATADGRVDVYRIVFEVIDLDEDNAALLHHNRLGKGPSIAEIRDSDYSNFAWERALAEDVRGAKGRVPVLWDPKPIEGKRIVGFASGKVEWMTEQEWHELR
ncbi:MAG: hypothetical protein ACYTEG_17550 [Planctomycetota bacterium]